MGVKLLIERDDFSLSVGKGVGHILEDRIINAKNDLWIVSPWISPEYADLLAKKTREGVRTRLVTTVEEENEALEKLFEKKVRERKESFLGFFTRTVEEEFLVPKTDELVILERSTGKWGSRFVHSKIYIIDDKAAVGSVNFTKNGFWENFEDILILNEEETVNEVKGVFDEIVKNPMIPRLSIEREISKEEVTEIDSENIRALLMDIFEEEEDNKEGLIAIILAVLIAVLIIAVLIA